MLPPSSRLAFGMATPEIIHSFQNVVYASNHDDRCFYCPRRIGGKHLSHAAVDHLWPDSLFGSNRPANLVAACRICNLKRGDVLPPGFEVSREEIKRIKRELEIENKREYPPLPWMAFTNLGTFISSSSSESNLRKSCANWLLQSPTPLWATVEVR